MFKIKIVHKGIFLVAVPLIVGVIFNSMLCWNLYQANAHIQRELTLKDAMITFIKATRCASGSKICAMSYLFSREPYYKENYQFFKKQATIENDHLKKLLKNEKGMQIPELQLSGRAALTSGMGGMMGGGGGMGGTGGMNGNGPLSSSRNPFYLNLKKNCEQESAFAMKAINEIQAEMILGLAVSTLIAVALVVFFNRNIQSRLLLILANTISLSRGTPLSTPLKGNDEIAELDQFVYKSGTEIRELERFKREMIGVVSHELKSPLSSVGSFLSSFSSGVYGELSAKAKDKADRTYKSVKRLMGLVAELLYLDRLEMEMNPEQITVSDILTMSVDSVKELSEKSGIEIVINNSANQLYADRNRIVQVIVNLVSNAMKFSPPEGKVTIEAKERDGWLECRVTDQGRGIPEEFRKTIFEPFKQVDATDATTKKGTGLGLTISKSIIEQHGGTIGVDSEEGKGSAFWFKVPVSPSTTVPVSDRSSAAGNELSSSPKTQTALVQATGKSSSRKFSVLQQGLVIISVPLIFQFLFVGVVATMVGRIKDQTLREEKSKEVLDALNRMSDGITQSAHMGMMYTYTKNPLFLQVWEKGKRDALILFDKATANATEPQDLKDIHDTRNALDAISKLLKDESTKDSNRTKAKKFADLTGMGDVLQMAQKDPHSMIKEAMRRRRAVQDVQTEGEAATTPPQTAEGNEPQHEGTSEGGAQESRQEQNHGRGGMGGKISALMEQAGGPEGIRNMMRSGEEGATEGGNDGKRRSGMRGLMKMFAAGMGGTRAAKDGTGEGEGGMVGAMGGMGNMMGMLSAMGGMGGEGGMTGAIGAMGMFGQVQSLLKDSVMVKLVRPFLEGEAAQERLMDREKVIGEKLSKQREAMINNLRLTLLGGFALSIGISSLLALSLMRSLTERLQHVMENTGRLVKREPLDAPKSGSDEIAYLDRVLFETGNHLLELETFKRELISIVSHELRTPLMSISSSLQLFNAGAMGELSDKGRSRLKLAIGESERLIRLINDLLDIEKMDAGKFILDVTRVDISQVMETTIESVRELAESRQLNLESECFEKGATIFADKDRLCQVLINLLSNAVKYSPANGTVKLIAEVFQDDKIKFSVIDRGRGIPDELQAKIFDRFVQVEESDATVRGGSGLGLAISKAIVEQHGGTIGVESQIGYGSTFWFILPTKNSVA